MATANDNKFLPKVKAAIARLGRTCTVTIYASATLNDVTGEFIAGTGTPYTVTITPLLEYSRRLIDGDMIQENDAYVLLAGMGLQFIPNEETWIEFTEPDRPDIEFSGIWRMVNVKRHSAGELVAAYEIQLRK